MCVQKMSLSAYDYWSLSINMAQDRNWENAEKAAQFAVAKEPHVIVYHMNLAAILAERGKKKQLKNVLYNVLSVDPSNLDANRLISN